MNSCFHRRLTDRRCCCWTCPQCRSVWTWSWDRPSSCAITLRGSSWHFISSLLRSWRGVNSEHGRDCILFCVLILWKTVFSNFDISNTGHPFRILHKPHCVRKAWTWGGRRYSFWSLKKEQRRRAKVLFRKDTGEDWKTEDFKTLWCHK